MADETERTVISLKLKDPQELAEEIFGAENILGVARNAFRVDIVLKTKRAVSAQEQDKLKAAFPKFKLVRIENQKGEPDLRKPI